jgi:hypothetical protein
MPVQAAASATTASKPTAAKAAEPEAVMPKTPPKLILSKVTAALRPAGKKIAQMTARPVAKLPKEQKQAASLITIATAIAASLLWGILLMRSNKLETASAQPFDFTDGAMPEVPPESAGNAHGPQGAAEASHGKPADDGHGAAKKDDGHGSGGHGDSKGGAAKKSGAKSKKEPKKPAEKPAKGKKAPKKDDGHSSGGH